VKLDDLCEHFVSLQFPAIQERSHPDRDMVLRARSQVGVTVIDDEFLVDCISHELDRLGEDRIWTGLEPFYVIPPLGIRFAFGYWPPGATAGPHEHTAWTITAVCRNQLEVLTYDREQSYRRMALVSKSRFEAEAGKTGFIYEPCIHEPRNTSSDWSLSLHITSPRDGERPPEYPEPLVCLGLNSGFAHTLSDDPYTFVLGERRRQRFLYQLGRILTGINTPQAQQVLTHCLHLSSSRAKRMLAGSQSEQTGAGNTSWILSRTSKDLVLSCHCAGRNVSLNAHTAQGISQELIMNDIARDTIEFVAKQYIFDVYTLPGKLSNEERSIVGEALEETGLFRTVRKWEQH
jgi:hypothetical protein